MAPSTNPRNSKTVSKIALGFTIALAIGCLGLVLPGYYLETRRLQSYSSQLIVVTVQNYSIFTQDCKAAIPIKEPLLPRNIVVNNIYSCYSANLTLKFQTLDNVTINYPIKTDIYPSKNVLIAIIGLYNKTRIYYNLANPSSTPLSENGGSNLQQLFLIFGCIFGGLTIIHGGLALGFWLRFYFERKKARQQINEVISRRASQESLETARQTRLEEARQVTNGYY